MQDNSRVASVPAEIGTSPLSELHIEYGVDRSHQLPDVDPAQAEVARRVSHFEATWRNFFDSAFSFHPTHPFSEADEFAEHLREFAEGAR